jgi:hypothetical protein
MTETENGCASENKRQFKRSTLPKKDKGETITQVEGG